MDNRSNLGDGNLRIIRVNKIKTYKVLIGGLRAHCGKQKRGQFSKVR